MRGDPRDVEPDLVAHGVRLHGAVGHGDGDGAEAVAGPLRPHAVHVAEILAGQVGHVEALQWHVEEVVRAGSLLVRPRQELLDKGATREGVRIRAGDRQAHLVDVKGLKGTFKNKPLRDDLPATINESLVVELYSK